MTGSEFWALIQEANAKAENTKAIPQWLVSRLMAFPATEIIDYSAWEAMFLDKADDERLWAAASIVADGLSDDGFDYFKCWLIAQGEAVYKAAVENPDSLADIEYKDHDFFGPTVTLEEMLYVTSDAYNRKMRRPRFSKTNLPAGYQPPPGCDPGRTARKNKGFLKLADDKAVMKAHFPKLMKRFSLRRKRIAREKLTQKMKPNGQQLRDD